MRSAHPYGVALDQALDIAPTGMSLKRAESYPVGAGETLDLRFQLPGTGREIRCAGRVVTDVGEGRYRRTGLAFEDLEPVAAHSLARYCRSGCGLA